MQFNFIYLIVLNTLVYVLLKTQLWYVCTILLTYSPFNYSLIIIILWWFSSVKRTKINVIICWFLFIIYYLLAYKKVLSTFKTSIFLVLGYNSIHPYIFYGSIVLLVFFLLYANNNNNNILINSIFLFSSFGFLLGSFWGWGNSIWGFFWVNDKIEQLFFSILLLLIIRFHVINNSISVYLVIIGVLSICFNLFLVRIGLSLTRHNFFDISTLVNISLYTFLWVDLNKIFYIIISVLTGKLLLIIILLWLVNCTKTNYLIYKTKLKLVHILICIFFISWLKFKEANTIYIYIKKINIVVNTIYTLHNIQTLFFLILMKKKLILFKFFLFSFYFFKILVKTVYFYSFYYYSLMLLGYLISKLKIYSN